MCRDNRLGVLLAQELMASQSGDVFIITCSPTQRMDGTRNLAKKVALQCGREIGLDLVFGGLQLTVIGLSDPGKNA